MECHFSCTWKRFRKPSITRAAIEDGKLVFKAKENSGEVYSIEGTLYGVVLYKEEEKFVYIPAYNSDKPCFMDEEAIRRVPSRYSEALLDCMGWYTVAAILIFWIFRLYHSLWKYASIEEMTNIIYACVLTEAVHLTGMKLLVKVDDSMNVMPRSFWPLELLFLIIAIIFTEAG